MLFNNFDILFQAFIEFDREKITIDELFEYYETIKPRLIKNGYEVSENLDMPSIRKFCLSSGADYDEKTRIINIKSSTIERFKRLESKKNNINRDILRKKYKFILPVAFNDKDLCEYYFECEDYEFIIPFQKFQNYKTDIKGNYLIDLNSIYEQFGKDHFEEILNILIKKSKYIKCKSLNLNKINNIVSAISILNDKENEKIYKHFNIEYSKSLPFEYMIDEYYLSVANARIFNKYNIEKLDEINGTLVKKSDSIDQAKKI